MSQRDVVTRLIGIARGLEDDGHYNAAKVFRAAAAGEINSSTREHLRLGAGLEEEMNDVIAQLDEPGLVAMLNNAASNVASGIWATLEDIPATFVCRSCGRVVFEHAPDRCPDCRARPFTFQEVPPAFYLDPVEPEALIDGLWANLEDVLRWTDGVTEVEASRGVWPLRDIVNHLLGAEQMLTARAVRMLEEDDPELTLLIPSSIDEEIVASVKSMVEQYSKARQATIALFGDISSEQWQRTGYHPEWGRYTVQQQMSFVLRHEQSHLAELELRSRGE